MTEKQQDNQETESQKGMPFWLNMIIIAILVILFNVTGAKDYLTQTFWGEDELTPQEIEAIVNQTFEK